MARRRRKFGRDDGLIRRMLFTGAQLGLLQLFGFAAVLFSVLEVGPAPML